MSDIKILSKTLNNDELCFLIVWECNGRKGWFHYWVTEDQIETGDLDDLLFIPFIKDWIAKMNAHWYTRFWWKACGWWARLKGRPM